MTRAYASPLRAEQVERTRERILEALAEQLGETREEFSIPRVAKRAGVSTRTVYQHFPNREAQTEALARWIEERVGHDDSAPSSLDEVGAFAERMQQRFVEHEALLRAQLASGVATEVRARRRRGRDLALDRCVTSAVADPAVARLAAAGLRFAVSADVSVALMDRHKLAAIEAASVGTWVARVLSEAIARGDCPRVPDAPARRR